MTFEDWWNTNGIAKMGMQPGDVYRAARDTALAAWEAATNAEREACAILCDENVTLLSDDPVLQGMADGAADCAADIRARGEP